MAASGDPGYVRAMTITTTPSTSSTPRSRAPWASSACRSTGATLARSVVAVVLIVVAGVATDVGISTAQAQEASSAVEKGAFGLGVILGEPTGIAAKLYLDDNTAIDAAAGIAVIGGGLHVHGDFLWHPAVLEERDVFVLPVYVGVGARVNLRDNDDFHLGARGVVGLLFDFKDIPLDVFIEMAPVVDYVFTDLPEGGGINPNLNFALGARYYL